MKRDGGRPMAEFRRMSLKLILTAQQYEKAGSYYEVLWEVGIITL
jgi:hypothetical protein